MKKRILAGLLAVAMLTGVMSGCDRSEDKIQNGDDPQTGMTEYSYQAVISPLDQEIIKGYTLTHISSFSVSGNTAYFIGEFESTEQGSDAYVDPVSSEMYDDGSSYCTEIFTVDLTTNQIKKADYHQAELPQGMEGSYALSELCAGPDGTVWVIETAETYTFELPSDFDEQTQSKWSYYTPSTPIVNLLQFNEKGEQLSSVAIDLQGEIGSYFSFMADRNGYVYCADLTNIYLYDFQGAALGSLSYDNGYLIQLGTAGVGILAYGIGGETNIYLIDPVSLSMHEPISVDHGSIVPNIGNEKYLYTYLSNGKIFGSDASSDIAIQIVDLLSCDINDSRVNDYCIQDDGRLVALQSATVDGTEGESVSQYDLIVAELTANSSASDKEILTLACEQLDNTMKDHIIRFNQTSEDVRIVVKNYATYGTDALTEAMNTGNLPDIVMTQSLPVEKYASQGLLVDLWPMIEQDAEMNKEDLMVHLFDTASIDGKLYEAAGSFTITTAAGNAANVANNGSWTRRELNAALSALNEEASVFAAEYSAESYLNRYLYPTLGQFVDYSNASADFNSAAFTEVLEFAYHLSEEDEKLSTSDNSNRGEYSNIYNKTQLLMTCYVDNFDQIKYANAMHRGTASFVGYPTETESGSVLVMNNPVAITSACSNQEAAWKFVRTFLTEDSFLQQGSGGFPSNKNAFDSYVRNAMTPVYQRNEKGEYVLDATGNKIEISHGSLRLEEILSVELFAVTKAEYDQFINLYDNCHVVARTDSELAELIMPEINTMFTEGRSVKETAAAVQDVATAYLKEIN